MDDLCGRSSRQKSPRTRFSYICLLSVLLLLSVNSGGCFHAPQTVDTSDIASLSRIRPIDIGTTTAEAIGQKALAEIGYDEIIRLADKAGFVEHKSDERIQLVSYGPVVATGFVRVFSRYALAAAVTSQADSPLPGPADIAAVGVLVIGLLDAGLLDGSLIKSVGKLIVATGEASVPATVTTDVPADRSDCRAHLTQCLDISTSRSRRGSGSNPGQSICVDCFDLCSNLGGWPDKTGDGKDCHWWDGR